MCVSSHQRIGVASLLFTLSAAVSIPSKVQNLYDSIVAQGECNDKAATGFYALSDSPGSEQPPPPSLLPSTAKVFNKSTKE